MSLNKFKSVMIWTGAAMCFTTLPAIAHDHGEPAPQKTEQTKLDHSKMDHTKMNHSKMNHTKMDHTKMDHTKMDHTKMDHTKMDHTKMNHTKMDHTKMDHTKMDHTKMDHTKMDHTKMDDSKMNHDAIKVHMAWSGALPPVATNGAVYLMVHNYTKQADALVGATTPMAQQVIFHSNENRDGATVMVHQTSIALTAGGAVTFKPGGMHIMLVGLTQPLVTGQSFPLTLQFENAGDVVVNVKIKPLYQ